MSRRAFEEHASSREDLLLNEFINLAINRFNWSNLPKGLTSEKLEEMLICHGLLGGFMDNDNFIILPIHGEQKVNMYNEQTKFRAVGYNSSYQKDLDMNEVVKLKNNPLATEDFSTLSHYAKLIDDIEMTQGVNLFQQNIPKIISSTTDGTLTAKNIIDQLRKFKFVIFMKKGVQKQVTKNDEVLDTSSPYLLDKLIDYENATRNKVLTFLGINNANTDKKERLITSEVDSNNDLIANMLDMMYDLRVRFCKEVKEQFHITIKVEKREVKNDNNKTSGTDRE